MFLVDEPSAVPVPPASPAAGSEGWFIGGDPVRGVRPTPVRYWWLNMIQGELSAIVAAAGIVRSKVTNNQVLLALRTLFVDVPSFNAEVTARVNADAAEATARNNADIAEGAARSNADVVLQNQFPLYAPLSAFGFTPGSSGVQHLPGGFILAWGSGQTVLGDRDLVGFPAGAFPNNCLAVVVTESQSGGWNVGGVCSPTIYGSVLHDKNGFFVSSVRLQPGVDPAFVGNVSYTFMAVGF